MTGIDHFDIARPHCRQTALIENVTQCYNVIRSCFEIFISLTNNKNPFCHVISIKPVILP